MPSIKDQSTVGAIATAFCEHRCKSRALQAGGYSKYYSERAGLKLFTNVQLIVAIKTIDDKTKTEHIADKAERQQFWTTVYLDTKANMGDRLRASELLGKSQADFTDNIRNIDDSPPELTAEEIENAKAQAKSNLKLLTNNELGETG